MMEFHPAANIFPLLEGEEFRALVEDIRVNGLREPIRIEAGTRLIVDGRNRYRACLEAGVEPAYWLWEGGDPVTYVLSLNLHRRHLNESQRAMVADKIATLTAGRPEKTASIEAVSQAQAATQLNVSRSAVQRARTVHTNGAPELVAKVERGEVAVSTAAVLTDLPKPEQARVVELTDAEVLAKAKEIKAQQKRAQLTRRHEAQVEAVVEAGSDAAIFAGFSPQLYSVWNFPTLTSITPIFGSIPPEIVDNLLYYYTKPGDLVFDPFGGGGSTADKCRERKRKCYISDLNPHQLRPEIKPHDITTGLPADLPAPDLVFLDPPYWRQARGKYSDKPTDLGNVEIYEFLDSIERIAAEVATLWGANPRTLALIIGPQKDAGEYTDLAFLCLARIVKHLPLKQRIIVPYSTQVHGGAYVQMAKDRKEILYLFRDLMIFGE